MNLFLKLNAISLLFLIVACGSSGISVPENIKGKWTGKDQAITIRSKSENNLSKVFTDTLDIDFEILKDNTAKGKIGNQTFNLGKIKNNKGLPPHLTGVAYIVDCGSLGKLSDSDPLERKNIEIWISRVENEMEMKAELHYKDGMDDYPMGSLKLNKVID